MEPVTTLDEPNSQTPAPAPPPRHRWVPALLWAGVAIGCTLAVLAVLAHLAPAVGAAGGCGGG